MNKFAVGYINFFDNNLIVEIVEADNWFDAIWQHSKMLLGDDEPWLPSMSLEDTKIEAFNADMMIDVIKLD